MVHYIKLFAPPFAGTSQEKHTYSWRQKERVCVCGGVGVHVADWKRTTLIWFVLKQAFLYTCRITQNHPITLHNIHTLITWASLLESSQLLFRCKRKISLSVTNSRSHTKRNGNSIGGSAAREGVTFSLYGLTYLFPSMWQNMAHDSFIGFTVWGCIIVENSSICSSKQQLQSEWHLMLLCAQSFTQVWNKALLERHWHYSQFQSAVHPSNALSNDFFYLMQLLCKDKRQQDDKVISSFTNICEP